MTGLRADQHERLIDLGFTSEWDGLQFEVPGKFGFEVIIKHEDFNDEPVTPTVGVRLGHQCDSWDIVEDADKDEACLGMATFIAEARTAYDLLARVEEILR